MSSWGASSTDKPLAKGEAQTQRVAAPQIVYDRSYYRNLFNTQRAVHNEGRFALVGHENTCKTGLAMWLLEDEIQSGKTVYVFDVDNSAMSTIMDLYLIRRIL